MNDEREDDMPQDLSVSGTPPARFLDGTSILVVEDNVILSMHLAMVLEDAGATVVGPFPFAEEALEAIKKAEPQPDIAVLDYELTEGTSAPIAERLQSMEVPFAFFTSHDAQELSPWSERAIVVEKPSEDREILDAVRSMLKIDV